MPRKRIIDANAAKFSIVVDGKNKKILDELVENYDAKYSPIMNKVISTFCDMSPNLKSIIETALISEYHRLTDELKNNHDPFFQSSCEKDLSNCEDILRMMNCGKYELLPDNSKNESTHFLLVKKEKHR